MTRVGSSRSDPNIGVFPIPGTNIGFPTEDPTGIVPDEDITSDPEICNGLEQIPLSGVSCDGTAPVYFKYFTSIIGCYECVERRLMPINITFSRICYKLNPCPDTGERTEDPLNEIKDVPKIPNTNDPGSASNVYVIDDPNNPFQGWNDDTTYYGKLNLRWTSNGWSNWEYLTTSSVGTYYPGSYPSRSEQSYIYNISWRGKPTLSNTVVYENVSAFGGLYTKVVYRSLRLNGQIIRVSNGSVASYYQSLRFDNNPQFHNTGSTSWTVTFLEATISYTHAPPIPPPPINHRRNVDMPQTNCCSCADIRLMLERQKKDIIKRIDEKAIDYVKIVNIVNQLGVNITKVNFDLSNQIKNFNELNFNGIAGNIGILNQTLIELSNAIITVNNENTFYLSKRFDTFSTEISLGFYNLSVILENYIQELTIKLEKNIIGYIALVIGRLEIDIKKKIDEIGVLVIREITEEIILNYSNTVKFIAIENLTLSTYIIDSISNSTSNSVRYAIKVIIEEILKNRTINSTNFVNISQNFNEYLALMLLQLSTEIRMAIEGLKLNVSNDLTLVNNNIGGIGAVITPIITNVFNTQIPVITNIINNGNTNITNKIEQCCNSLLDLLDLIISLLNLFKNDGINCPELTTNTNTILNLVNSLFNKIDTSVSNLESSLNIKLDNLNFDFDLSSISNIVNQSNQAISSTIVNEIRNCCDSIVNVAIKEVTNLISFLNSSINSQIESIINSIAEQNNVIDNTIKIQLQTLNSQLTTLENFNTSYLENFKTFTNSTSESFSQLLVVIKNCCEIIEKTFFNISEQNTNITNSINDKVVTPINTLSDSVKLILTCVKEIDTLIKDKVVKDFSDKIALILLSLTKVEELLNNTISGDININCGSNNLSTQFTGKSFAGISSQLKSITEVLRLIVQAVCIEVNGSITIECGEEKETKYYLGTGIAGLSDQLKAITTVETKVLEKVCEQKDEIMPVLYPAEQFAHIALQSQLQIYFGLNYPKATGDLFPLYVPAPKMDLSWDNFETLIRNMGQEYVRIQWDNYPKMGSGLWGVDEAHLTDIGNKIISLSNDTATLRFTKGGKRKQPIIERQLRAVRAVLSIMDANGSVTQTQCYLPPR